MVVNLSIWILLNEISKITLSNLSILLYGGRKIASMNAFHWLSEVRSCTSLCFRCRRVLGFQFSISLIRSTCVKSTTLFTVLFILIIFLCIWNPFYYYFLSIFITLVFSFYIKTSVHVFVMVAFKILALFVVSGFCFVFIHLKKNHQCTQNKIGFPNQMLKPRIKKLWKLVWI